MGKRPALLLFLLSLSLAACGGGGGGPLPSSSGTGPTPTPTPVRTATPTPTPSPTPTPIPGAGQPLIGPSADPNGSWGPPGVANALDFPVQHGSDGTGQTVAIVIDSDVSRSDLSNFFSYFKIPTTSRTITTRSVDGATGTKAAALDEATLDTETVAGLAPGANVIIYQIPDLSDQSITDAYNAVITDGKAFVVNSSFGGCEGTGPAPPEDPVIASGAAKGITFTASAGDSGNVCDDTTTPATVGASWPASNPHVVGIGGTETDAGQGYPLTSQTVWMDTSCGKPCGGGGGVSGFYAIPTYQQGVAGMFSTTHRNVPDFSLPAEDVGIFQSLKWVALNGTSWSSPEAAALYAELYQYCGANGGKIAGVTEPATIAYYVAASAPADFLDVNSGNDQYKTTTPFYTAVAGYDDASGFGVPKGWAFVQTACPGHTPASGLAMHRTMAQSIAQSAQHAGPYTVDVTPRVGGISDLGIRNAQAPTRIQVVLQPDANVGANEASVVSALQSAGFTIVQRFSNHLVVDAVAPSATIERYFRTQMHDVVQGQYGTRYLPTTQIVVPGSIAPYVSRVSLDNVITRHTRLSQIH